MPHAESVQVVLLVAGLVAVVGVLAFALACSGMNGRDDDDAHDDGGGNLVAFPMGSIPDVARGEDVRAARSRDHAPLPTRSPVAQVHQLHVRQSRMERERVTPWALDDGNAS